jgi:hypothetical protein
MRKRISCKIIKSVPLGNGNNRSVCSVLSTAYYTEQRTMNAERSVGTSSYTPRLVVINASIDDKPATQFLDCCA